MKRRKLIEKLREMGCILVRHGGAHDWYHKTLKRNNLSLYLVMSK